MLGEPVKRLEALYLLVCFLRHATAESIALAAAVSAIPGSPAVVSTQPWRSQMLRMSSCRLSTASRGSNPLKKR